MMSIKALLLIGCLTTSVSAEDAGELFDKLAKDHKYTDLEKDTIAYIRENYNWTEAGDKALRFAVRSWAATRGAAE